MNFAAFSIALSPSRLTASSSPREPPEDLTSILNARDSDAAAPDAVPHNANNAAANPNPAAYLILVIIIEYYYKSIPRPETSMNKEIVFIMVMEHK